MLVSGMVGINEVDSFWLGDIGFPNQGINLRPPDGCFFLCSPNVAFLAEFLAN
jgi:hypothetical protein